MSFVLRERGVTMVTKYNFSMVGLPYTSFTLPGSNDGVGLILFLIFPDIFI